MRLVFCLDFESSSLRREQLKVKEKWSKGCGPGPFCIDNGRHVCEWVADCACCCSCRKTSESSEDECECSDDDEDEDEPAGRHCRAAVTSSHDTTLLHRHRGAVGLPTAFDGLPDLRDPPADRGPRRTDRLHSAASPAASERTLRQPFVLAEGAHGVDNGLDATTYF